VAEKQGLEMATVYDLLPTPNKRRGDPIKYMLDRTLMRPRDVLAFINTTFSQAGGKNSVSWEDIHEAEPVYSRHRLLALRDEWKISYPGIDEVFEQFRDAMLPIPRDEFSNKYLDSIALLTARPGFAGKEWLSDLTQALWNSKVSDSWGSLYQPLILLLYKIGFIGCAPGDRANMIYHNALPDYVTSRSALESITHFSVHPAFQASLDVKMAYHVE